MIDLAIILVVSSTTHQSKLTYNRPYSALPILGKPMVVRTMERLYRTGIQNYIVIVGEGEGAIAAYLNSQWLPNVHISFRILSPGSSLLRTLTDITLDNPTPFLITSYNCFTHTSFPETLLKRFSNHSESLLLTGASTTLSKSASHTTTQTDSQESIFAQLTNSQPHLTLGNLAICGSEFIEFLTKHKRSTSFFSKHLLDIFQFYINAGYPTHIIETSWLLQIEADYDLLTLNQQMLEEGQDCHILSELHPSIQITPPVRIDPNVSIGQGTTLGPRVYLESGCSIGSNSKLTNTIVLQNTIVPMNSKLTDVIVTPHSHITSFAPQ